MKKKYGIETYDFVCNFLYYLKPNDSEILFKQGDIGDKFYIILSGSIDLYQTQKDLSEDF